jgi:hypothetical protein
VCFDLLALRNALRGVAERQGFESAQRFETLDNCDRRNAPAKEIHKLFIFDAGAMAF